MKILSFIIPCYRSVDTIEAVVKEVKDTVKLRAEYDYEIILVNDSSPDNTFQVLEKISLQDKKVKSIDLAKNFGQHAAIMTGINNCKGDLVICLDDDGQTPADEVFKLIDKIDEGYDVVYASYNEKKHSIFRNLGSYVNDLMARSLLNKPKDLYVSSYFVMKKFVVDEIVKYENSYPYLAGLILRTTNRIINVPVNHRDRENGQSGYTFKKLFSLWLNGFTSFSLKPLRISSAIGGIFAFLGIIIEIYVLINKINNPSVPLGWSSIFGAIILIGGVILFVLGMIGEYIGRIYISINNNPQYVIRTKINISDDEE